MPDLFPSYHIGHFLNQPDQPQGFAITRFGTMAEPNVADPHRHTFYEVIWTEAGRSRQRINYREYTIEPGSLFFISPGQLHFFEEYEHLRGGSILFTEAFFLLGTADKNWLFELSFLDNFYANPLLRPRPEQFEELRETITLLEREAARADRSDVICRALLQVLLSQIQRCVDQQAKPVAARRYVVLFKQFQQLLDLHYLENVSAAGYAERLAITAHHLNVVCKAVTGGQTASAVVRGRKLLEARHQLAFTDQPVAEVAAGLHFLDPSYFARLFRAETGRSPAEYQRVMSEKYRRK